MYSYVHTSPYQVPHGTSQVSTIFTVLDTEALQHVLVDLLPG